MDQPQDLIEKIDAVLMQTQCRACDYKDCRDYARAIVEESEVIHKCEPGGEKTLRAVAALVNQDPLPYLDIVRAQQKPDRVVVVREDECIGCTKCIQACPVDAILGASKLMHTVIEDACTGCELCIEPCPVDCIDVVRVATKTEQQRDAMQAESQARYQLHLRREQETQLLAEKKHQAAKLEGSPKLKTAARKDAIMEAILRSQAKKQKAMAALRQE